MEQLSTDEKNILKLLRYGADAARTTAYLAGITGLDTRTVRNIIRRLVIDHGVPVVGERTGSYRGYYIATDQDELARASGPLKNEIKQLARRNRALIFAQIRTDWLEYLTTKGDQDNGKSDI
ncbi:Lrp/AsnC family transcriptional regulator [Ligilactobacillus animalis]|uniref:Lrp/AsnC family transcriptional regulator n=1 Tax=Ligilactobacillus animalis TaxID=1605 RepID=UPI00264852BA|nr:Lrp/AsnC family transcriptional regulator [Ligilactobacillus animalis]WKB73112.1 Lrp/AsnC family transcriptional regulator [Ligilactobacillus animalis]